MFNRGFPEKRMAYTELLDFDFRERARQKVEGRLNEARGNIERAGKTFVESCVDCKYVDFCEGVWNMYLEKNGPGELVPVRDAAPETVEKVS